MEGIKRVTQIGIMSISRWDLFLKLGGYDPATQMTRIVSVDEFVGEYAPLKLGNGGDWCRRSAVRDKKLATMKRNGKVVCLWDVDEEEEALVEKEMQAHAEPRPGVNIQYMKVFGVKEPDKAHPIRADIKQFYQQQACCVCGSTSELVCDHKNDLYNDPRVLSTETQVLEDFQSLCNHCNLQKRQVSRVTRSTGKRYGASQIPSLRSLMVDFTVGCENYDPNDVNAMVGTYWHDPIAFIEASLAKSSLSEVGSDPLDGNVDK